MPSSQAYPDPPSPRENVDDLTNIGQFVLVEFEIGSKKKYYVGNILDIIDKSYDCSFMRQTKHNGRISYVFPDVEDTSLVDPQQICKILSQPTIKRGHYYFTEVVLSS